MLGYQDVAMEHYGAEPRPPLAKCLMDVEDSDIYIGLIGRRYGWIPPGSTKSITEQEYRHAVRCGKTILIFVLNTDVPDWHEDPAETPEQQAALQKFREELSTAFLLAQFSSCDQLALRVIAALANLGTTATTYDPLREDKLLELSRSEDDATRIRAQRGLVDMGSGAYAAELRQRLRRGHATPAQRTVDVRELAEIEARNHRVIRILGDLLTAGDPATLEAVVFEFAQRAWQKKPVSDDDVRAILKLAKHESPGVRREVGHSMWKFLPRSREVRDEMWLVLNELIGDPDSDVRQVSMFSMSKVNRARDDD